MNDLKKTSTRIINMYVQLFVLFIVFIVVITYECITVDLNSFVFTNTGIYTVSAIIGLQVYQHSKLPFLHYILTRHGPFTVVIVIQL